MLLKKENKKKRIVLFNSGQRFGNTLQNEEAGSSIGKDSPQGGRGPSPIVSDNETDFNEEQYPPAEDRYKQLEDRLNAMEIQQVPGLDFGDLGLSTGVIIPHKFKAPSFTKYDGASCPKLHLRSYLRKILLSGQELVDPLLPGESFRDSSRMVLSAGWDQSS